MSALAVHALPFRLPHELEAGEPPELRGAGRDDVRMLVAQRRGGRIAHGRFADLPRHLREGDVLVVNASATVAAALPARREDGDPLALHVAGELPDDPALRLVEPRAIDGRRTLPFPDVSPGELLELPAGGRAELAFRFRGGRLFAATLDLPEPLLRYLGRHGAPIRYGHVAADLPLDAYQTVFGVEPGSAEMPSAARPFTPALVTELVARGVEIVPILLHTGVSSLEGGEPPYPERFRVSANAARRVNAARAAGGRVVAVGTTSVRALESAAGACGELEPRDGLTDLVVTPERGAAVVDGLLSGWHEPSASHIAMIEAVAGRELTERSYAAALEEGYLWHEFGDLHLILP